MGEFDKWLESKGYMDGYAHDYQDAYDAGFDAGQQSQQTKIAELQARVDNLEEEISILHAGEDY